MALESCGSRRLKMEGWVVLDRIGCIRISQIQAHHEAEVYLPSGISRYNDIALRKFKASEIVTFCIKHSPYKVFVRTFFSW
jgi:hypothetical protein